MKNPNRIRRNGVKKASVLQVSKADDLHPTALLLTRDCINILDVDLPDLISLSTPDQRRKLGKCLAGWAEMLARASKIERCIARSAANQILEEDLELFELARNWGPKHRCDVAKTLHRYSSQLKKSAFILEQVPQFN